MLPDVLREEEGRVVITVDENIPNDLIKTPGDFRESFFMLFRNPIIHEKMKEILATIGNTPLVALKRFSPRAGVRLWVKVEGLNPGGSVKDRTALAMVEAAEAKGRLHPGLTILEATSGNTGIGLAMVAAVKGYRCRLVMSEGVSVERRMMLEALGAEILLTPAAEGTDGAIAAVREMMQREPDKYYHPDQFNNPANWQAHYRTTAPEIWRDSGGAVTHVVAALGTGGTLTGLARYFRDHRLPVKSVAVEPLPGHKIQGLKNMQESLVPGIYDPSLADLHYYISDEEAYHTTRRLAREEGLVAGMSSGAALAGALRLAHSLTQGNIVVILPDRGERYLSTPLFRPTPVRNAENLPQPCGSGR